MGMAALLAVLSCAIPGVSAAPLLTPNEERFTREAAERMITASQGTLAQVYAPIAEQIVADYGLAEMTEGIGIDLGSGPGSLIFELCRRTRLHWVNADVNPHFFPHFFATAEAQGLGHRVSAVFADAQALPFRDNYADIIVSRGSYHFWDDMGLGFKEILRVLKPGGVAYIGRGFARDMPVEIARSIRDRQGRAMVYDREAHVKELVDLFEALGITAYNIELPAPPGGDDLNYGVWIELRAPQTGKG